MARRKRTREEIEEARRDNERVNATPAAPEEPAAKKRRRTRRSANRRNLTKAMAAIRISDGSNNGGMTEGVTALPSIPTATPVAPLPTTAAVVVAYTSDVGQVAQERRHRDAERQRRRRAAITLSQQQRNRSSAAERARARRADMSPAARERARAQNAERQRARRARLSDAARTEASERDRLRLQDERSGLPNDELRTSQENARLRVQEGRDNETAQERRLRQEEDRLRHLRERATRTTEAVAAERERNRLRTQEMRANRTEEEQAADRERARIRRRCAQKGLALCNQEDFRASMVTGPNIVDGRHRLPQTTVCEHCNAWKWPAESKKCCCIEGAVQLPPLGPAPPLLMDLLRDSEFRRQIRAYNQAFAFTSVGTSCNAQGTFGPVNQDESVAGQRGVYTYRIQGAMGHYLGSLLPYIDPRTQQPVPPKFAQIYIVDPDMEQRALRRRGVFSGLDPVALGDIEAMLAEHNPFAQQFITCGEIMRERRARGEEIVDVRFRLHADRAQPGTHNLPTVSEVAVTMVDDGNLDQPRDIILYAKDRSLMRLYETHASYDPLQYPLLLPYGEMGWTYTDEYASGIVRRNKTCMSLREHVAFRLYQKEDDQSALHQGGRLFQQYCVDQRAKCEQENLRWVATHQAEIRADQYCGVRDALMNEDAEQTGDGMVLLSEFNRQTGTLRHPDGAQSDFLNQIGKRVVLPSSYTGGPRAMYQAYQDSMTIVREYGKPDLFITKTCNPCWEEIMEKLPRGQTAQDRPDIVARVWQLKLTVFLKDLDQGILGQVEARVYVVEFQKRGLPHAHILTILAEADKPRARQLIDKMVSAELPDKDANPQLYETVLTCMMHGPCGAANPTCVCMKDGKCSKGYPKPLAEVTKGDVNGFPEYRRRRRAAGTLIFNGKEYDNETVNQWVVPYNPYLSQKYNCHVNCEICTALSVLKYLFKYVHKGSDRVTITIEAVETAATRGMRNPNEILKYLNSRYVSPIEACMRLLEYSIQGRTHAITQLTIHLEDRQIVTFRSSDDPNRVITTSAHTMLTRFFELCASDAPENQVAKAMLYKDIPKEFCWKAKSKRWVRRKRYQAALGRLIHVSPRDEERFHMRILLCHRKGPTSFRDLRTVDGVYYESYLQAALAAGYLEDDNEWESCMCEAALFRMPFQLRQLFVTMIVYCQMASVRRMWDRFYDDLSEDFAYTYRNLEGQAKDDMVKFHTLKSLNDLLEGNGTAVANYDLPQLSEFPALVLQSLLENNLIRREMEGYDHALLQATVDQEGQLNVGQKAIYDKIIDAIETPTRGNKTFFIDGPGGTGKSTLLKHILAKVRLSGKIALAVASSGIASLLLMGGRTAHSTFRIPLKLNANSTCSIYKQSHLKALIAMASLVIWDEAPMTHRHAFEAVDRSLRDILDNEQEPFGGKVFVLSGDFRQILPVVVRGSPADTINACLKSSPLWHHFTQLHLTENMRVTSAANEQTAAELAAFSEFLLEVGEGRHEVNSSLGRDFLKIPKDMLIDNPPYVPTEADVDEEIRPGGPSRGLTRMIDAMYADINNPDIANDDYFANRTVLTTTNAVVQRINEAVSERLEGDAHEYLSNDSVETDGDANFFEQEMLNTVNINGIPPHKLTLKKGAPIMMMRNLNPDLGLCNGTRLRIVELKPHVIHATIMTGERQGQHVLIPRIVFISDGDAQGFPFRLRRKQFPVQPAFAMTINKAQGQTVQNMGLYLATPCFSHGQLYVALSRVTARDRFKALIEHPALEEDDGSYTDNIVYRQIFDMGQ